MIHKYWMACSDYTWPKLNHRTALTLIKGMGFDAVDIGLFYGASHILPEEVHRDFSATASRAMQLLDEVGIKAGDVFFTPGQTLESRAPNNPDPAERAAGFELFTSSAQFAAQIGARGITLLPGIRFSGESYESAIDRSAQSLRRFVDYGASLGLEVSFEPHDQSCTDSPERTMELVEKTEGLKVTLDASHYEYNGYGVDTYRELLPYVRHVQVRCARKGGMQTSLEENEIDLKSLLHYLAQDGYQGGLACEYVWIKTWDCNRVDNVSETVLLKNHLLRIME